MILAKNLKECVVKTIALKVVAQMHCKLGGAPWGMQLPLDEVMIVGYSVCRDTVDKTKIFGATVASIDEHCTRYFSTCSAHTTKEELSNDFALSIVKAIKIYERVQGNIPNSIVIYRDSVDEKQLKYVFEHEVKLIEEKLKSTFYPNDSLKMCFIVVSKKINTKIFTYGRNPPPGTIVDKCITFSER